MALPRRTSPGHCKGMLDCSDSELCRDGSVPIAARISPVPAYTMALPWRTSPGHCKEYQRNNLSFLGLRNSPIVPFAQMIVKNNGHVFLEILLCFSCGLVNFIRY